MRSYWSQKVYIGLVYARLSFLTLSHSFTCKRITMHGTSSTYQRALKLHQLLVTISFSYWDFRLLMIPTNNLKKILFGVIYPHIYICGPEQSYAQMFKLFFIIKWSLFILYKPFHEVKITVYLPLVIAFND